MKKGEGEKKKQRKHRVGGVKKSEERGTLGASGGRKGKEMREV